MLISDFLIFFDCLTLKNDLRTKEKSNKPTISSENEIEKWHLRNQLKRYRFSKHVKFDKQRIFVIGWMWRALSR